VCHSYTTDTPWLLPLHHRGSSELVLALVYTVQSVVFTVKSVVFTVQSVVFTVQSVVFTVQSVVYFYHQCHTLRVAMSL